MADRPQGQEAQQQQQQPVTSATETTNFENLPSTTSKLTTTTTPNPNNNAEPTVVIPTTTTTTSEAVKSTPTTSTPNFNPEITTTTSQRQANPTTEITTNLQQTTAITNPLTDSTTTANLINTNTIRQSNAISSITSTIPTQSTSSVARISAAQSTLTTSTASTFHSTQTRISSVLRTNTLTQSTVDPLESPADAERLNSPDNGSSASQKSGAVAGGIIGGLFILFLIGFILVRFAKKRKEAAAAAEGDLPFNPHARLQNDTVANRESGWRSTLRTLSFYTPSIRPVSSFHQINEDGTDNRTSVVSQNMAGKWTMGNPTPVGGGATNNLDAQLNMMTTQNGLLSPTFNPSNPPQQYAPNAYQNYTDYNQPQYYGDNSGHSPQIQVEPPTQRSSADIYAQFPQHNYTDAQQMSTLDNRNSVHGLAISNNWESSPDSPSPHQYNQKLHLV